MLVAQGLDGIGVIVGVGVFVGVGTHVGVGVDVSATRVGVLVGFGLGFPWKLFISFVRDPETTNTSTITNAEDIRHNFISNPSFQTLTFLETSSPLIFNKTIYEGYNQHHERKKR